MDEESTTPNVNNPEENQGSQGADDRAANNESNNPNPSESTNQGTSDDKTTEDKTDKGGDTSTSRTDNKFDKDIDEWAAKQNLPKAESDEQRQSYQNFRDSQREYTRKQQEKSASDNAKDLSKSISEVKKDDGNTGENDDPSEKRFRDLEKNVSEEREIRLQSEFYTSNNVTDEQHNVIKEIMQEKFSEPINVEGKRRAIEIWSNPSMLPDLLNMAKARLFASNNDAVIEATRREEREKIAKESEANGSGASAKTVVTDKGGSTHAERTRNWFEKN